MLLFVYKFVWFFVFVFFFFLALFLLLFCALKANNHDKIMCDKFTINIDKTKITKGNK